MRAKVVCVGKDEFINKTGKTSYVLHLIDVSSTNSLKVYRAFTSKAHYDAIEENNIVNWFTDEIKEGFLNFDNGFTHFYLPKDEVH